MNIVDDLHALRLERGYTQKHVAASIHVAAACLSQMENHHRIPRLDVLLAYADAVGADLEVVAR